MRRYDSIEDDAIVHACSPCFLTRPLEEQVFAVQQRDPVMSELAARCLENARRVELAKARRLKMRLVKGRRLA